MQSSKDPAERKAAVRPGTLYVVATPIGNLSDVSARAAEVLAGVGTVLAEDTRRTRRLLTHLGVRAPLESHHEHNEARTVARLLDRLAAGESLALVSDAGTPAVSDPGYRLVCGAIERGLAVVPVPGPSAVLAALVASGLPTDRFLFVGYPPRKPGPRRRFLADLAREPGTLVLLESPHRLVATIEAAADALGADRRACVAREMTKLHEEFLRGTLAELAVVTAASPARGEITLCVAGASARAAEGEQSVRPDPAELRQRYAELLESGLGRREALRRLTAATQLRRREVYGALHLDGDSDPTDVGEEE